MDILLNAANAADTENPILKNDVRKNPIIVSKISDKTIHVDGECSIVAPVPIICEDYVEIRGTQNATLRLVCTEDMQPCIGPKTHTGMSYGRWSPNGKAPTKIIIDGCKVICESKVRAFSLGCYGSSANIVPEIVLRNGGSIECPEVNGNRLIVRQAMAPAGSTKISESMVYAIATINQKIEDLYSEDKKRLIAEVENKVGRKIPTIGLTTSENALNIANRWLSIHPTLNPDFLLNGEHENLMFIKKAMFILGMSAEMFETREIMFETYQKIPYVIGKCLGSEVESLSDMYNVIYFISNNYAINEFTTELMYDMIPSYFYNFHHSSDHESEVKDYLEESGKTLQLTRQSELETKKYDIARAFNLTPTEKNPK